MALGARRANGGGGSGGGGGGGNGGSMGGGGGGGGGGDRELKGFATFHMLPSTAEGCEKLHPANLKNCTLHLQKHAKATAAMYFGVCANTGTMALIMRTAAVFF